VDGFLSPEECGHISSLALPSLGPSFLTGGEGGDPNTYRSSSNSWVPQGEDPVLLSVQARVGDLLGVPAGYLKAKSEDLQVVRYRAREGGQFKAHHDSSRFHRRLLTVLVYLNTPELGGGETWFPFAPSASDPLPDLPVPVPVPVSVEEAIEKASTAEGGGLKVEPVQGRVAIFLNHLLHSAGESIDPLAVHAGLPLSATRREPGDPREGVGIFQEDEKWIANYWVGLDIELLKQI
jgi:hypothetical protein